MRIGFHYHIPAMRKQDGAIYIPGYLGVFIDGLAQQCDEVICFLHSPLSQEQDQLDYKIKMPNVELVDIGQHVHMLKRTAMFYKYTNVMKQHFSRLDLMLVRGPSPLLPFISYNCKHQRLPYAYLLVGDYVKSLSGVKMPLPKRSLLWLFYQFNKISQDFFARDALVYSNNPVIFEEYKNVSRNVHEIRTTTLSEKDFFKRKDTCQNNIIKLAYAGRIEPMKGLDDILDTVLLLSEIGINTELHVAGWDPNPNQKTIKYLHEKSEQEKIKFVYHGKKKVGEDLLSFYRGCDIYIQASKGNEGFPRTIWEAMAQSMPVIATRVGAIPNILEDGESVLLVDESSPQQLAEKITSLKLDGELRKKLIQSGYDLAQKNTIEEQSKKMVKIIKEYLQDA